MDDRGDRTGDDDDRRAAEPPGVDDEPTSADSGTTSAETAPPPSTDLAPPSTTPPDYWQRPVDWGATDRPRLAPPSGTIGIGSVIVRSFDVYVRRIEVFLALSLPSTLISLLSSFLTVGSTPGTGRVSALALPLIIVAAGIGIAFTLAMVIVADDARAGRPVELGSSIRRGFARTLTAIVSAFAQFLVVLGLVIGGVLLLVVLAFSRSAPLVAIGSIVLGIGLFYVVLRWSLVSVAIALEPVGPVEAIGRSRAVTRGNVWRLFALFVILGIVALPLGVAVALLSITQADLVPATILSIAAGLFTGPLLAIITTMVFGDLTGRPEEAIQPRSQWLLAVVAVVVLVVGSVAVADALPKVGPALERIALQAIPVEARGKLVAGITRNPLDPCLPTGAKTTFSSSEPIYLGGYLRKPIPRGETGIIEIFVNGRSVDAQPLSSSIQSVVCYYEAEPLVNAQPASYRVVVTYQGETIAEGSFTVQ